MRLIAGSGSRFDLHFTMGKIVCEISSGSNGKIHGQTRDLEAKASSGAELDARELKAVKALAKASSGGALVLHATGELAVKASSGGSIHYAGTPVISSQDVSSGGRVSGL